MSDRSSSPRSEKCAWAAHNLSQLEYFRSLTLRQKLEAVQGMADVTRRLMEMRRRGELQQMIPVDSTAIAHVGYDASTRTLRLEYTNGRVYDYFEVPPRVYEQLLAADSVGEFVNREVKPHYDYAEVE